MNYYYITGTSRGIGKALVEQLVKEAGNRVIGLSRSSTLTDANYSHCTLDLSQIEAVSRFNFGDHPDAEKIVLINNAGTLGEVKFVGKQSDNNIKDLFNVNLVSACMLMNKFVKEYTEYNAKKIILNISSGAAQNPVSGWSAYCASKASLDMYSKVIAQEQEQSKGNIRIKSIAPGIVDTQMQQEIRNVQKVDFPRLNDFIQYKNTGQLSDPMLVSQKILRILAIIDSIPDTVISLRDF